ncbi:MAG: helix-turn-helix domain-containing protein [Eubacteriales bacterium]|jgi:AraC-like DNA-binding protein/cupin superfamily acireductone dioxygenase involved in methionine salvage
MTQKQDNLERYNTEFTFEGVKLIFYFEFLTENSNGKAEFNIFHTHDMAELFVCTGPFIYINTNSGLISLSQGDSALIPAGMYHCVSKTARFDYYRAIRIKADTRRSQSRELSSAIDSLLERKEYLVFKNREDIGRQAQDINDNLRSRPDMQNKLRICSLLSSLLDAAEKTHCPSSLPKAGNIDRLTDIERYASTYFMNNDSTEEIAAALCISPRQLYRICMKRYGKPLHALVNETRLSAAAEMLSEGDAGIDEISETVGFRSVSSFYRRFKEKYGIAPGEYRKEAGKCGE